MRTRPVRYSISRKAIVIMGHVFINMMLPCSHLAIFHRRDSQRRSLPDSASKVGPSQKRLWEHRQWQVLMHYQPRLLSAGVKSQVDDPSFFLSPSGKFDPRAELEATLSSFFAPSVKEEGSEHSQCAFIARYHWLKQELGFDPAAFRNTPAPNSTTGWPR
jgi:hypothetical protein